MPDVGTHVVAGVGPVGRAILDELVERRLPARAVVRRRVDDLPDDVEVVEANLTDPDATSRAMAGASVVYHAASAPYDRWPELLPPLMRGIVAGTVACGARLVYADNLYAYGPVGGPLTEDLPSHATGPNGRVRAILAEDLMKAHEAGGVRATIGRASDYFGARGLQSTAGERLFGRIVGGKPAQLLGNLDVPHTFTYLPDFGRALVTLGTHEEALGHVWHVPSADTLTSREFATLVFEGLGRPIKIQVTPAALLAVAALFNPTLRAVHEQRYQRDAPWIVDHTKFARAFGADVTPHREAIATTTKWFSRRA